jgi:tetratricopeptide (TPR) repeat protein
VVLMRIVLIVVSLLTVAACSRSERYYIERGNTFLAAGKPEDAAIQYRKAIQTAPESGEAYYRLGLAQLGKGDLVEAFRALSKATELSPSNENATAKLGDVNLAAYLSDPRRSVRFYNEVSSISNRLLQRNTKSVDGLRLKGALALLDRKPLEAIGYYRPANQLDPKNADVVEGLAQALFQNNQSAEGERLAEAYIGAYPKAGTIYDVLYLHYSALNRPTDAESILKRKVENNPKEVAYRIQLARFYAIGNKPQMTGTLTYLLDRPQDFPQARLQIGDFYNSLGDHDHALGMFQEGARNNPKERVMYQKRMVDTLAAQGKMDEAANVVDLILKEQPKDTEALIARASILLDSGKQENVVHAVTELQSLVKQAPDDVTLRFRLGRAYWLNGDHDLARGEFLEASRRRLDYVPARLALAELGMNSRRPQETLRMTEEILSIEPGHPRARLLHAAALVASGVNERGRSELATLLREYPQSEQVQMQLGILAVSEKRFSDAEEIFRRMQRSSQGDPLATAGLAEAYTAQSEFGRAIDLLQAEEKKAPNSAVIGPLLAFTAVRAGKYDTAISAYQSMLARSPKQAGLYRSLGEAYFAKGDYAHSIEALQQACALASNDGRAEMLLVAALDQAGRTGEVKAHMERALQLQPDNPVVLNNMAFYLAENGSNLDDALKFAQHAVQIRKDDPTFADTLGWIYTKKNMHDAAVQIFNNLVAKQPNNPTLRYHLGVALLGKGDTQMARTQLKAALDQAPQKYEEQRIREVLAKID